MTCLRHLDHSVLYLLLRSGACGAWYGGTSGQTALGLTVPITTRAELMQALVALQRARLHATLLIPSDLAATAATDIRAAAYHGHEIAGWRSTACVSVLDIAAARSVKNWDITDHSVSDLFQLNQKGIRALPLASKTPEPGLTVRIAPGELVHTVRSLKQLGYQPMPVCQLPGLRAGRPHDLLLNLYQQLIEDRFARLHQVTSLTTRADAVMRMALRPMPPQLPFPSGGYAAELHLHSSRMVGLNQKSALTAYRAFQRSLQDVAQALREHPEFQHAAAVFAVSLLHKPLEKNGFSILPLPFIQTWTYSLGFRLMRLVHGTAVAPSEIQPKIAWMPREAFLQRHLTNQ